MKRIFTISLLFFLLVASSLFSTDYKVKSAIGVCKVILPGETKPVVIKAGMTLPQGAVVFTGLRSKVMLNFGDSIVAVVLPNTKVELSEALEDTGGIKILNRLKYGKLKNKVNKGLLLKQYKIVTPVSTAGVRGTDFALNVDFAGESSEIYVFEGEVEVEHNKFPGVRQVVKPGEKAFVTSIAKKIKTEPLTSGDYKEFEVPTPKELKEKEAVEEKAKKEEEAPAEEVKAKPSKPKPKAIEGMNMQVGARTVEGEVYYLIQLQPEFRFGKWGIGLDLNIHFNDTGIRKEDWDEPRDFLNIINYISYGAKGEKVYARFGTLEYTLGHGFIMRDYVNNIGESYKKRLGLNFDYSWKKFGIETVINDVTKPNLIGMRGVWRPFGDKDIMLLKNLGLGASLVHDFKEHTWIDTAGKEHDTQLNVVGLDAELPVFSGRILSLILYSDLAVMNEFSDVSSENHGFGMAVPGVYFKFASIFDLFVEYRILNKDFMPSVIGTMYEVNKPQFNGYTDRTKGFYSEGRLSLLNMFVGTLKYEGYEGREPTLFSSVELVNNTIIPQLRRLKITYYQRNIKKIFDLTNKNAAIIGELAYALSGPVTLVYKYKYTFDDAGNPVKSMSVTTEIALW